MPGVTLHLFLAARTLEELRRRPDSSPFPTGLPTMRNAFFQGALGPDFGYFPGGHQPLSDLAHRVSTGDLARTLVRSARTPIERAFAWGWLTHVIADQRVHPHIGRRLGSLRTGDPSHFIGGDDDQSGHVRVETGVDAAISVAHPDIARLPLRRVFNRSSITYLSRGYELTYGLALPPRLFLTSHTATTRLARGALFLSRAMGRDLTGSRRSVPIRLLRGLLGRVSRGGSDGGISTSLAYLSPLWPDRILMERVGDEIRSFPDRFLALLDSGLAGLENRDLDTGEPERAGARQAAAETVRNLMRLPLDSAPERAEVLR